MSEAESNLYQRLTTKPWLKPDILIHMETPEFYEPVQGSYNIGFTMWETSKIPSTDMNGQPRMNWVHQMNRMDEIWTASQDALNAFQLSGVKKPVRVFNGPVDTDFYKPGLPELPIRGLTVHADGTPIPREERPFVIGFMGQWTRRKNIEDWLLWIMTQFGQKEAVGLLKTYGSHLDQDQTDQVQRRVELARQQIRSEREGAGITLITNKLSDRDIARWFQSVDMYVSFSRGEGYALPVVQAMACGRMVAHTAWGGP
jgi:glycosyltransferase involved in cell wall biosynthesis